MLTYFKNLVFAIWWAAFILLVLFLALTLMGCSVSTTEPSSQASVASVIEEEEPPPVNDMIQQFGQVITWQDGISISVSEPMPYEASTSAAGVVEGWDQVVFEIVLTNESADVFEPFIWPTLSAGGQEAKSITDLGNDIGLGPSTSVLPGQSVKWLDAFSVASLEDMTMEVIPDPNYESGIFTNIPF